MVEFAIVMTAALTLILGIIEFALAYWTMNQLQLAVEETGRYAYVMINDPNIAPAQYAQTLENRMQEYLTGSSSPSCTTPSNPPAGQYCVYASSPSNPNNPNNTMTLQASYGFNLIGLTGNMTLASENTVPLD